MGAGWGSQDLTEQGLAPYQGIDVHLIGGAAVTKHKPVTSSTETTGVPRMWGILRVLPEAEVHTHLFLDCSMGGLHVGSSNAVPTANPSSGRSTLANLAND